MDDPVKICVKVRELSIDVELNNSLVSREIIKRLPVEAVASRWGDEIYFAVPAEAPMGPTTLDVNVGDVCFFHQGKCLCIFFGRTPSSAIDKPVPEAPVEIIGRFAASADMLRSVNQGDKVSVVPFQAYANPAPSAQPAAAGFSATAAACGERKLSQTEIDDLVQRLLAEKKKAAGGA